MQEVPRLTCPNQVLCERIVHVHQNQNQGSCKLKANYASHLPTTLLAAAAPGVRTEVHSEEITWLIQRKADVVCLAVPSGASRREA
jgi:hypothetical protein